MNEPRDRSRTIRQWVEKAEHDLRNAEHTLTLREDCPFDTVAFHAQQCAEKYLKALLIAADIDPPKTHDLRALMQLVPSGTPLSLNIEHVTVLNRYSIEARYPGDWEPIDRPEAEEAVAVSREVRGSVRACLPSEAVGG